jgi:8-oxo-dGTP pyrophosphatase MutT (NUDIX family)
MKESLPPMKLLTPPGTWDESIDPRGSAVLALFMRDPNQGLCLLFTRRASEMRSHAGQVGFPGGRREVYDQNPSATALRETHEEIGLGPEHIKVLGMLAPLKSLDTRPVLPIVGYTERLLPDLTPNPSEVAEIFLVPWEELTREKRSIVHFNIFGKWRETPFYEANGHHIWGLTAWMIDFLALTAKSD